MSESRVTRVMIVEDDADLCEALTATLETAGHDVITADCGESALTLLELETVDLVVSDVQMEPMDGVALLEALRRRHASLPVVLMTAYGTIEKAVEAMRLGAAYYMVKPFEARELVETVGRHVRATPGGNGPVAGDPTTRVLLKVAERVAASEATVTISGESGTGKEVFARYIHRCSPRAEAPFVAINCAAIPENMLEAVLFGHEKGAFTGATSASPGKFEQAQGGTLLLDEISEMALGLQAKLLRVLQEREVERIGGRRTIPLDVRVLATTNRDLRSQVQEGRFREDLFYRLNVFPLNIPPLRERRGDILPLVANALENYAGGMRTVPALTPAAEQKLAGHHWPGNVRELENLVQRTLIMAAADTIDADDLIFEDGGHIAAPGGGADGDLQDDLWQREQQLILEALREGDGSRKFAAERLGISARTLRYKLAKMRETGVDVPGGNGHGNREVA
ncbi:sigma-54-dependent transcriptional regulator [Lentisalinibacter salinarum]|uniref:sigma-54-dependent transcriptional regulator n=1 Tax=Lentisalinibacter salinarum TaxID=2992239 RepID=UPI003865B5C3